MRKGSTKDSIMELPIAQFINEMVRIRFWAKVLIKKPDECWPFIGCRDPGNYGRFGLTHYGKNRPICAHQISWIIKNGDIPKGQIVRHTCNNRPCCNPKHLIIGTHLDNAKDMVDAGRSSIGIKNGNGWLTKEDIIEIRRLLATGMAQLEIALLFGVSRPHISQINVGGRQSKVV